MTRRRLVRVLRRMLVRWWHRNIAEPLEPLRCPPAPDRCMHYVRGLGPHPLKHDMLYIEQPDADAAWSVIAGTVV